MVAQDFVTPSAYFEEASRRFGAVQDMMADITIFQGEDDEEPMVGRLQYKSPNKLRIDFTRPREQVLAVNGELLTVYVPRYSYVLEQRLQRKSDATLALMASKKELAYLRNNYSVAYLVGPDPVPLEEGSNEMVVKLKFQSLSSAEGFRQLEIAFDENQMIRRVTGSTGTGTIIMDYRNARTNQGIPDAMFDYEAPANANVFRNFLFEVIE
jgi:outer membrane lipoprotein-sorting protein